MADTVFFTNLHSAPVTLTELVVRGGGAFSTASQSALPLVLAPAESVGVDVQFVPLAAGPTNSTLSARQAGQGAPPLEVNLSARALGPTGADLLFTAAPEAFVEAGGEVWVQEYGFNGGALARLTDPVQGTDLDGLFQWVRTGTQFRLLDAAPQRNLRGPHPRLGAGQAGARPAALRCNSQRVR